ncbi:MAG TPA: aminotransferase class V-fold PLP-dependent enzyme [Caulobacteraceae bacterium]
MEVEFGRLARGLWSLAPDATFLNHGSYGACPRVVQAEQDRFRREMEAEPDDFVRRNIVPTSDGTPLRAVAARLGGLVGAPADRVALVENATVGIQSILQSVDLDRGDEILITSHQYNAVRLQVEARCRETGAVPRVVQIPLPTTADEALGRIGEAAGPRVKLAIIDHITSATALVLPIAEIVADLRQRGVRVLVDGAHAIGQIPLDVGDIGADWYVTNAHKWLFAPKGSALLHAADHVAAMTRPCVTSHFVEMGFPKSFDYLGTRDYSGWLAIPEAVRFHEQLGPERLRRYNAGLVAFASQHLLALGAQPVGPIGMCASMRAFVLPQRRAALDDDALALKQTLWDEARIQVNAAVLDSSLLIRVSGQAYVEEKDFVQLSTKLDRRGWPGR